MSQRDQKWTHPSRCSICSRLKKTASRTGRSAAFSLHLSVMLSDLISSSKKRLPTQIKSNNRWACKEAAPSTWVQVKSLTTQKCRCAWCGRWLKQIKTSMKVRKENWTQISLPNGTCCGSSLTPLILPIPRTPRFFLFCKAPTPAWQKRQQKSKILILSAMLLWWNWHLWLSGRRAWQMFKIWRARSSPMWSSSTAMNWWSSSVSSTPQQ